MWCGLVIYAGGLRVSDAVQLKVSDADGERKQVLVRGGKGGKDRHTVGCDRFAHCATLLPPIGWETALT